MLRGSTGTNDTRSVGLGNTLRLLITDTTRGQSGALSKRSQPISWKARLSGEIGALISLYAMALACNKEVRGFESPQVHQPNQGAVNEKHSGRPTARSSMHN